MPDKLLYDEEKCHLMDQCSYEAPEDYRPPTTGKNAACGVVNGSDLQADDIVNPVPPLFPKNGTLLIVDEFEAASKTTGPMAPKASSATVPMAPRASDATVPVVSQVGAMLARLGSISSLDEMETLSVSSTEDAECLNWRENLTASDRPPTGTQDVVHTDREPGRTEGVVHTDREPGRTEGVVHTDREPGRTEGVVHTESEHAEYSFLQGRVQTSTLYCA